MTAMQEFTVFMLGALSDFLAAEPVVYLFGVVIFCFLCKMIKILTH